MTQIEWDPDRYLADMLEEVPGYVELQREAVAATQGIRANAILELGVGTGETSRRLLELHPAARLVGIDASAPMLERARETLPTAELHLARLQDPLPAGQFDLVVSALAVHHLNGEEKRDLFRHVAEVVRPGGRFVLADVVVPERPEDAQIEIDWVVDLPDRLDDQLDWLRAAGFDARATWSQRDLAVISADRPRAENG